MANIPKAKESLLQVRGSMFVLVPAISRTHYEGRYSGGTPFAFAADRTDDAWLVLSRLNRNVVGLLEDHDRDWSFQRVDGKFTATHDFKHKRMTGFSRRRSRDIGEHVDGVYWEMDRQVFSGPTPEDAVARGMGYPSNIEAEISAITSGSRRR